MPSDSAWVLHHVVDALDNLLKARKEVVALIVRRIEGENENLTEALESAIIKTKQAGSKLARLHPDSESLAIQKWTTFAELGVVGTARREKKPGMSQDALAMWAEETIRKVTNHAAEIEKEIQGARQSLCALQGEKQESSDDDGQPLDKLTPKQRELVRYLRSRPGKESAIRDAMKQFGKRYTSAKDRKSFITFIRRLNERFTDHYPAIEIDQNRCTKTIKLVEN